MHHLLKIKRNYLNHILESKKLFEIRYNDRDYQVGDTIDFTPEDNDFLIFSGLEKIPQFEIIYVHHGYGMENNFVVLSISPISSKSIHDRTKKETR